MSVQIGIMKDGLNGVKSNNRRHIGASVLRFPVGLLIYFYPSRPNSRIPFSSYIKSRILIYSKLNNGSTRHI